MLYVHVVGSETASTLYLKDHKVANSAPWHLKAYWANGLIDTFMPFI